MMASSTVRSLSPRQREVFRLLADGRSPKEVARALGISCRTVGHLMVSARDRLGTPTMLAAIARATALGLLSRE